MTDFSIFSGVVQDYPSVLGPLLGLPSLFILVPTVFVNRQLREDS
jgi:hypothetical protein